MLVTAAGRFVTQRSHRTLALLRAVPEDNGITLEHPHAGSIHIMTPALMRAAPDDRLRVTVWRREIDAIDAGESAAEFARAVLGEPARIVAGESDHFADGYPLLICTQASLDDLNRRLPEPLPMSRFRPNIVLSGGKPWQEDHIRQLRVGRLRIKLVKACARCVMTGVDQLTGQEGLSPLPALREFRFNENIGGVTFGWNARLEGGVGGVLRVGDAVEVDARG
jgi:uncharacterized protein YcbX